ncbi:hypothetical protein OUZ56_024627 [Daphnia magna]|uniref:Uncharacterized protein n=1 Tax=Daphnia magna TaxID=35525 RepID=A0ABR0B145_9CRUS|nr:hypothetical protein OUZ56_024627 [Daphnia magna]
MVRKREVFGYFWHLLYFPRNDNEKLTTSTSTTTSRKTVATIGSTSITSSTTPTETSRLIPYQIISKPPTTEMNRTIEKEIIIADATEKWQIPPGKATPNEAEKPEARTYESPINEDSNYGLPTSINELNRHLKFEIGKMHEQYKISMETEHENKLAKEIRDVYCQLSKIKRTQAIILAQTNGILPAAALGLPICSRLYDFGQAMTLQQCKSKRILLTANETKCEFQPF